MYHILYILREHNSRNLDFVPLVSWPCLRPRCCQRGSGRSTLRLATIEGLDGPGQTWRCWKVFSVGGVKTCQIYVCSSLRKTGFEVFFDHQFVSFFAAQLMPPASFFFQIGMASAAIHEFLDMPRASKGHHGPKERFLEMEPDMVTC